MNLPGIEFQAAREIVIELQRQGWHS